MPWFWPIGRSNTTRSLAYLRRLLDEPVAVADALGGDQDALGVQAVEDVAEALAFLADQVLRRDLQVVDEHLVGLVVHHVADRLDRRCPSLFVSTRKIDMPSRLLLHLGERRGAREQDHQLRVLQARGPDLLAVDDVAVALAAPRRS